MRFEPDITIKESLRVFERFQKLSSKEFFDLYKKAMEVVDNHGKTYETPEMMFSKILRISNKKHPLAELAKLNKPRSSRGSRKTSRSGERSKPDKNGGSTFLTEVKSSKIQSSKMESKEPTRVTLLPSTSLKKM